MRDLPGAIFSVSRLSLCPAGSRGARMLELCVRWEAWAVRRESEEEGTPIGDLEWVGYCGAARANRLMVYLYRCRSSRTERLLYGSKENSQ